MRGFLIPLVLSLVGCAPYVHSPAGRMLALETAKTLDKGQTGVRVAGGGGVGLDLGFAGGAVRVRHGVAKNLDFRVEVTALSLNGADEISGTDAVATAGAGIKYAFNPYFAVAVDLTGGYWIGGGFLTPELNLIAAYENAYIVPFIDAGYYTSHPLSPNPVTAGAGVIGPPVFTHGWIAGAGARIPATNFEDYRLASAVILGTRFTGAFFDGDASAIVSEPDQRTYWSASIGVEVVFP